MEGLETVDKRSSHINLFTNGRIPSLDGLRAVSIILVIFSHLSIVSSVPYALKSILNEIGFGELGVRIFFTISGFLITYLLLKEKQKNGKVNLKAFYIRRFLRIFPVFYIYLIVVIVVNSLLNLHIPAIIYLGAFLYIQNFAPWGSNWLIAHSWSLAVEEQFYLLWPALFNKVNQKKVVVVWLFILLLGSFMRSLHYKFPFFSNYLLAPFFMNADFLFSGCFLAYIIFYRSELVMHFLNKSNAVFVISAIALVWFFSKFEMHPRLDIIFVPIAGSVINICICFLLLYFVIFKNSIGYKFLNYPFIAFIGRMSYSLYVWQQFFLVPSYHSFSKFWWTQFPLNFILVFITAYASLQIIEKPFLRLKTIYSSSQFSGSNKVRNRRI